MTEVSNAVRSNTTTKLRGGVTGKGFLPGDSRINRKGRPKSFDQVREIAQRLSHERLNGAIAIETLLREWRDSDEPMLQRAFVEYAFGKVPDKLETTGLENKTTLVLHFDHEQGITQR